MQQQPNMIHELLMRGSQNKDDDNCYSSSTTASQEKGIPIASMGIL
jgi:hypothetical protein